MLSALWLVPDDIDVVFGIIDYAMFYSDSNKLIFKAMSELAAEGKPFDLVTVAAYMRNAGSLDRAGGTPYLAQLSGATPAVANVTTHAQIIKDRWQARQLILQCHTFAASAYTCSEPSLSLIQEAEQKLGELASKGVGSELVHISVPLQSEIRLRQDLRDAGVFGGGTGTSTGFPKLDNMAGGLYDSDLIVAAGRPGMGKTALVMNIIMNLARARASGELPEASAFFSLEMPREQLALRFACAESGVDFSKARKNYLTEEEWSKLLAAAESLARAPIWIDDTPAITVLDVQARARKLQRDIAAGRASVPCSRLKLVVLDYMQLAQGVRGKNDNREREVASISSGMKRMAKELDVTAFAVSQLNRGVERKSGDKRPELSDLRESGAIEQDADGVWFVFRESYYDPEAAPGEAELIIRKQRNGATGTVYFTFQAESMRFLERAPSTYDDLSDDFAEDA